MNIFGGMKILWIFFFFLGGGGGSSQNVTGFWGHLKIFLCTLGSFLKVNVENGDIFFWGGGGVAKISNIFGGMPDIPDIFVNTRCWVQAYA